MKYKNSLVSQFQEVFEKGIKTLQKMIINKRESDHLTSFLVALISIKRQILESLTQLFDRNNSSTLKLRKGLTQIHKSSKHRIELQRIMSILYKIEYDQMQLFKSKFIPRSKNELYCKTTILALYNELIEQIESPSTYLYIRST